MRLYNQYLSRKMCLKSGKIATLFFLNNLNRSVKTLIHVTENIDMRLFFIAFGSHDESVLLVVP